MHFTPEGLIAIIIAVIGFIPAVLNWLSDRKRAPSAIRKDEADYAEKISQAAQELIEPLRQELKDTRQELSETRDDLKKTKVALDQTKDELSQEREERVRMNAINAGKLAAMAERISELERENTELLEINKRLKSEADKRNRRQGDNP